MAVEKDKVLAAIESKFKGKSITKTFKENLATKWAAKIESDEEIDAYIDDREDVIIEAAGEADRRATEAAKKAAEKVKKENGKTDPTKPEEDELPEDTPAWAKALLKKNEALEAKVNGFEQAQTQKSIAERFLNDERLKGVPEFVLEKSIPTKDEDFETAVTGLAEKFQGWVKENNIERFGKDTPGGNQGKPNQKGEASKEELDKLADGIMK